MDCNKKSLLLVLFTGLLLSGCFQYSFTGTSIPDNVNSVYIPFFADQSSSSIGNLSDRLNQALVDRFINQTRLRLANNRASADAVLEGSIVRYTNEPFSISGNQQTSSNEVTINVQATFQFTNKEKAEWSKSFSGSDNYDTNESPIEGESTAADNALSQIASNMFNDAVSGW
ncbi:MAG: LptE family protein [Fodinibius sp.]|nr:LptE family protein [Fodinibius sp.]